MALLCKLISDIYNKIVVLLWTVLHYRNNSSEKANVMFSMIMAYGWKYILLFVLLSSGSIDSFNG